MSNQQLYLAVGIPVLIAVFNTGVIIALLLHFVSGLNARMDKLDSSLNVRIDKLDARIDRIDVDLKGLREDYTRFYGEQRKHQEAIDILKSKVLGG